ASRRSRNTTRTSEKPVASAIPLTTVKPTWLSHRASSLDQVSGTALAAGPATQRAPAKNRWLAPSGSPYRSLICLDPFAPVLRRYTSLRVPTHRCYRRIRYRHRDSRFFHSLGDLAVGVTCA